MINFLGFLSTNFNKSRINTKFLDNSYKHLFDNITILNEDNLDDYIKPIVENNRQKYGHDGHGWPDRGYGYWIWKPYLIFKKLENLEDNDILIHLDIHCYLENVENNWNEIINQLNKLEKPVLLGWTDPNKFNDLTMTSKPLRNYIESQLNYTFTREELLKAQMESGIIFLRKNNFTVNLIKQWFNLMLNGMDYVSDMYNDEQYNHPEFSGSNRHDQSVLSLLCKYYHIEPYSSFDWWTFNHYNDGIINHSVVWGEGNKNYNK